NYEKFLQLDSGIDSPAFLYDRLYFITDLDGTGNIYSVNLAGKDLKQHTRFKDFFARNLRSDGKKTVFHKGGKIFIYDPGKDKCNELKIDFPVTGMFAERRFIEPSAFLEEYSISNDGSSTGFIVRGKPYTMVGTSGPVGALNHVLDGRSRQMTFAGNSGNVLIVNDETENDCVYLIGKEKKVVLKDAGLMEMLSSSPSVSLPSHPRTRFVIILD
ncbi:peptidase S41, partial [mine drainage metagenome]